ncbi:MAG: thiamine ABC transporter substrate-binding protein [Oligoflexia bacterium]|nr:thiamine ABC transporter substrate-binding protein [Oligoflexia bacterium]
MNSSALITLVIYAYSSFTSSWGVGPGLVKKFEESCKCKVVLVDAGDGGAMLGRLKLEGNKTEADMIIGIDETLIPKVQKDLKWASKFLAFDKGPYAFVYNSNYVKAPPKSLDDLLDPQWKGQIVIQDPRLSTVGLGLLLWIIKEKGEDGAWEYLKKLKSQVKLVTPNWDLAYGLFKKNQAKLVFSYWTSPAYHIQEEKKQEFKAAEFIRGHYVQTEYLVVNPNSKKHELAQKFSDFMLSTFAQEEIPKKNFMYPVNAKAKLTPAFKQLGVVKEIEPLSAQELEKLDVWLKKWREIFS